MQLGLASVWHRKARGNFLPFITPSINSMQIRQWWGWGEWMEVLNKIGHSWQIRLGRQKHGDLVSKQLSGALVPPAPPALITWKKKAKREATTVINTPLFSRVRWKCSLLRNLLKRALRESQGHWKSNAGRLFNTATAPGWPNNVFISTVFEDCSSQRCLQWWETWYLNYQRGIKYIMVYSYSGIPKGD